MNGSSVPDRLCASPCTSTCYRVFADGRPYGPSANGDIVAEDPESPPTWANAREHLLWRPVRTPSISVFNEYQKALDRAEMLEQRACTGIHIAIIDTYIVDHGELLDAHQIAKSLELSNCKFYEHECLFHRFIARERILAVLPAMGPSFQPIPLHQGYLQLPDSCFQSAGGRNIVAVKRYLAQKIRELYGSKDDAALQQAVLALCTTRDD